MPDQVPIKFPPPLLRLKLVHTLAATGTDPMATVQGTDLLDVIIDGGLTLRITSATLIQWLGCDSATDELEKQVDEGPLRTVDSLAILVALGIHALAIN